MTQYDKRPIAFFDSGVGGLTVYAKVKKLLPEENYLYFGDTKNMPYGEKTENQLIDFADRIFKFFEQENAKAVVMACNTTSAITYEKLKDKYNFKIYPIIQSVSSSLAKMENLRKLCIIATPVTINSHAYSREITKYNDKIQVNELPAPCWVKIVEEHRINQPESIIEIQNILNKAEEFEPDKIVLGCTHYPYLMSILKRFVPEEKFIDPSTYFAQNIKEDLEKARFEAHNDYFDIQYIAEGEESFGVALRSDCEVEEEKLENDCIFFKTPKFYTPVNLKKGDFVVVPPEEVHQPRAAYQGKEMPVVKVVVKVAVK